MLHWFRGKKNQLSSRRRRPFFKPLLEVLEDRRLLNSGGLLQGTVLNDQTNSPQSGATVSLYDNNGNFLSSQSTGTNGSYLFTGLAGGTYSLVETPPAGFTNDSTLLVSSPVESASNVNASTIQVTIPSSVSLTLDGSQFKQSGTKFNGTNNTPGIAATEVLSFDIDGTTEKDLYVGQFIASANSGPTFNTFCVDLSHFLKGGSASNVYSVEEDADLANMGPNPINTPATVGEISYLYNQYGTGTMSSVNAAALQVAIWAIEFDSTPSDFQSSGENFQLLGPDHNFISTATYNSVVSQAQTYITAAETAVANPLGPSGQAIFLAPTGNATSGGEQGVIAPGSLNFSNVPLGSPSITTTPVPPSVTLGTTSVTLTDTATLSGGNNPTGTITFTLYGPNGNLLDTEMVSVSGDGNYSTPTGYTLPTNSAVTGLYQWDASYSGDTTNSGASDNNNTNEQVLVSPAAPAINTTPNVTSVTLGTSTVTLTDTADLTGGYSPTGSITFTLYAPNGNLVDTETISVSGNGSYSTPTGYKLPTNAAVTGTYQWDATYSGDSNNNTVSDTSNTDEQVVVSPASPAITTTPNTTSVTLGTSTVTLNDTANLTGGYSPTGTITFTLYAPNGNLVDTESVTVNGNGTYSTPTGYTLPTNVAVTGTYQWDASYSGDSNNSGVSDDTNTDEQVVVSPASPAITTTPSVTSVTLGTSTVTLNDTADLTGGYSPTGTITFTLYAPNGNLVDTETVTVSGNGTYSTPTGYTLPTNVAVTGTYQWDATYSGDSNNSTVSDNNASDEQVVVSPASPAITTTPSTTSVTLGTTSVTLKDTADLTGGYSPTGSITFTLYAPNGNLVDTETVSVSGNGTYSTPTGYTLPTNVAVTGTYQWDASYSGDSNNSTASDDNASDEQVVVSPASPGITTTPSVTSVTLGTSTVTLNDTADLTGGYSPTGTITFTLYAPNGTLVDTEHVSVSGNGSYSTPTGYTLPTNAVVTGTYQWDASYSGDSNNSSVSDNNASDEQVVVSPASPAITTTPGPSVTLDDNNALTDSAALSGGYNPTGTITFYLLAPGSTASTPLSSAVYTDTVTVSGNGTYTTSAGNNPGGFVPGVTGTFEWVAVYSGDGNNSTVASAFGSEPETVNAPPTGPVAHGEFATIGFWHNKNGQAVIQSFNGGPTATDLGNWLASNFPNMFGTSNPYISKTLSQFGATSLAGLTNAQVAQVYENLWNPSGVTKNTYVQAFAVALGIYADTSNLSGTNTLASKYGFTVTATGFGGATYNVGSNGAAFGVANNTSLTVLQIMQIADANFDATVGDFFHNNSNQQTLTSDLNNVLNGINTTGDVN